MERLPDEPETNPLQDAFIKIANRYITAEVAGRTIQNAKAKLVRQGEEPTMEAICRFLGTKPCDAEGRLKTEEQLLLEIVDALEWWNEESKKEALRIREATRNSPTLDEILGD